MSVLEDLEAYKNNSYFTKHEYGDFTPFYIAITICSVIGGFLFILNIVFCWCSRHREYWQDKHTGNRWIQSLWVITPHKNPPLDLSELKPAIIQTSYMPYYPESVAGGAESPYPDSRLNTPVPQEYMELHKRESEI